MELYIHIPFCVRKCRYCSFVSYPASEVQKETYTEALLREADRRISEFTEPVKTVFIGGGTPSLLSPAQLSRLVEGIHERIPLASATEFTVEANPGTLTEPFVWAMKRLGVNRLSLGMQAFQDRLLQTLGRIHSFREVEESAALATRYGIENLNLDLIFGIPGQTMADWEETLHAAIRLHPAHVSAYGLIPEEGTPLFRQLESGGLSLPEPELERDMYGKAIEMLRAGGYRQYEISNFAKDSFACAHNIGYWTQVPYVGLGVSAASMRITSHDGSGLQCLRRTNPEDPDLYLKMALENDPSLAVTERIGPKESRFETMMLMLRMNRGVPEDLFMELHGVPVEACYGETLEKMRQSGLMMHENGAWFLTRKGMDIQNRILVELMED